MAGSLTDVNVPWARSQAASMTDRQTPRYRLVVDPRCVQCGKQLAEIGDEIHGSDWTVFAGHMILESWEADACFGIPGSATTRVVCKECRPTLRLGDSRKKAPHWQYVAARIFGF